MYPEFYAASNKAVINMDYYNSSIITLANSKVWLLIHPLLNEKIKSATKSQMYGTIKNFQLKISDKNIIAKCVK